LQYIHTDTPTYRKLTKYWRFKGLQVIHICILIFHVQNYVIFP